MRQITNGIISKRWSWIPLVLSLGLSLPQARSADATAPDQTESIEVEESEDPFGADTQQTTAGSVDEADTETGEDEVELEEIEEAEPTNYRNWIDFGVGGTIVNGSQAEFQRRLQLPGGTAFGGVEQFHYERDVGEYSLFQVDGRGIFNQDDYSITLDYTDPDRGFVRGGYNEFRTYYNGSGGFFPGPAPVQWYELYDNDFSVNRSEAWFEGGLRLPDIPQFTVRYSHQEREGTKDSTIWGAADTFIAPPYGPTRNYVPTFENIDEKRDVLSLDLRHTFGTTDAGVGVRFDSQEADNSRNIRQYPNQAGDSYVTQRDQRDTDMFSVHAFTESRFSEKVWLTVGYSYTDLDSDVSGYRAYGTTYDPDISQRLPNPNTFQDLSGNSQLSQQLANVNLRFALGPNWSLVPAFRIESQNTDSYAGYGQPASPLSPNSYYAQSNRGLLDLSESLNLRYTGLTNWVFYGEGYWLQGNGDLNENWNNVSNDSNVLNRDTDDQRFAQKYTIGSNWYPLRKLRFGVQYYYKLRDQNYTHNVDSTPNLSGFNRYPAFLTAQDYAINDVNFRTTWRARHNLTLVGQYDFQYSTLHNQADGLSEVESADIHSQIISGGVSWVPHSRVFTQGNLSYVYDRTDTPASDITPSVQSSNNDYWTANVTLGYVLDQKTDLEASYYYYRANNYVDNSAYSMPYGAGNTEQGVTAGVKRRMSDRVLVSLNYGFFTNNDETSGYYNNFDAHVIQASMRYLF